MQDGNGYSEQNLPANRTPRKTESELTRSQATRAEMEVMYNLQFSSFDKNRVDKEWIAITVQAGPLERAELAMDFIIVIDKSGSMKSDNKMAFVQATIEYFVRELKENHRIAVISFNAEIEVLTEKIDSHDDVPGLLPLTAENKDKVLEQLKTIKPEGATNMSAPLEKALEILSRRKNKPLSTLLFFTDGLANVGKIGRDLVEHMLILQQTMPSSLTIHTFGFGIDHDSKLLQKIALTSKSGVYYYLENVDMIAHTFALSLGTALSTVAYDVVVLLEAQKSCRIVNNYTKFPCVEKENVKKYEIYLGTLSNFESRTILTKLSLNKVTEDKHTILKISIEYKNPTTHKLTSIIKSVETDRSKNNPDESNDFLPPEVAKHYWRYMTAASIEDAVKEITSSTDDSRFGKAVEILQNTEANIKKTDIGKRPEGQHYVSALQEMMQGMENSQIFTAGIHYAHAYSTMFYLEKSSGTEHLMGILKFAKSLSIATFLPNEARKRYFPAYITYAQEKQITKAKADIPRYVEGYLGHID